MPPSTTIRIFNFPRQLNVKRLGMNLGAHIERTGSYLLKNVIRNPGFEAGEYGMIFFVRAGATATRVQADWNSPTCGESAIRPAQQADFWLGAEYEIVDGAALGRTGTITDFTLEDPLDGSLPGGHYTFFLDGDGPAPAEGDAIFVRQQVPGYSGGANPSDLHEVLDITRPGSPGAQSLRLIPGNQASWRYEVDSTPDSSSGKLLIADGDWHFEIWARAEIPGAGLTVRFLRDGAPAFLSQTFPLTTEWQHIEHDFTVPAGSDPAGAGG